MQDVQLYVHGIKKYPEYLNSFVAVEGNRIWTGLPKLSYIGFMH